MPTVLKDNTKGATYRSTFSERAGFVCDSWLTFGANQTVPDTLTNRYSNLMDWLRYPMLKYDEEINTGLHSAFFTGLFTCIVVVLCPGLFDGNSHVTVRKMNPPKNSLVIVGIL